MKTNHSISDSRRPYKQGARAEAAARTRRAIVDAFYGFLETEWYNDVSLERIAHEAGTTVQTLLRQFGSKEGVLEGVRDRVEADVMARRVVAPGDVEGAIAVVVEDYEAAGEMVLRFLAQEDRIPALRAITDFGRASHARWVRRIFAPFLDGLAEDEEQRRFDGLIVALDIYVWKLLRKDRGRSAEEVRACMKSLICATIGPLERVIQEEKLP